MKTTNAVAKNYGLLSPEERFRLIMTASGRGDEAERDRLARAGERLVLSMAGHAPYAQALTELSLLTYIEFLEESARYLDALDRLDDARDWNGDEEEQAEEDKSEADGDAPEEADEDAESEEDSPPTASERLLDVALAAGYILRTKADGWKLFCERLNVSRDQLWDVLPGFKRLQAALALTEKAAFVPEGMLRWLNDVRPDGQPELTEVPLTAERAADGNEEMFRERVEWWSGANK
jgi:hypothetical protein